MRGYMRLGGAVRTRVWEGLLERRGDLGTKESEREGWLQNGTPERLCCLTEGPGGPVIEGIQDLDCWEKRQRCRALFGGEGVNFSFTHSRQVLHTHKTQ